MSLYINQNDITNLIDAVNLSACTNDYDSNAPLNTTILNNIMIMASNKCDALVSSIYQPFGGSPPAKIKDAAIIFSCFALMQRRLTPTEKNPFKEQQDFWIDTLTKINAGELDLDFSSQRAFSPVLSVSTPSRANTNFY